MDCKACRGQRRRHTCKDKKTPPAPAWRPDHLHKSLVDELEYRRACGSAAAALQLRLIGRAAA